MKGIVELHGGEVRIASAGMGCGTEVCVLLPCLGLEPQPAEGAGGQSVEEQEKISGRA